MPGFAELARQGRLSEYDRFRRPVDQAVVRTVEVLSRIAAAESLLDRVVREWLLPIATKLPLIRHRMLATVTGLDHTLPRSLPGKS